MLFGLFSALSKISYQKDLPNKVAMNTKQKKKLLKYLFLHLEVKQIGAKQPPVSDHSRRGKLQDKYFHIQNLYSYSESL